MCICFLLQSSEALSGPVWYVEKHQHLSSFDWGIILAMFAGLPRGAGLDQYQSRRYMQETA